MPKGWVWSRINRVTTTIFAGGDKPKGISNKRTEEFRYPIYSNGKKDNGLYGFSKDYKVCDPSLTISARGTIGYSVVRYEPFTPIVRLITVQVIDTTVKLDFLKNVVDYLLPEGEGTSIPQLTVPNFKTFLVPVPPFQEQERIVEKINELFKHVDSIEKEQNALQDLSKQLKQKVLDVAMQGKLVPQDPNDEPASVLLDQIRQEKQKLYEEGKIKKKDLVETEIITDGKDYYEKLPQSWEVVTLKQIANYQMGKTPSTKVEKYWCNSGIPWFSIAELDNKNTAKYISNQAFTEVFRNNLVPKGTLLMSFKLSIGKVKILEFDAVHNEAIISIYPYFDENNYLRDYLYFVLPVVSNLSETVSAIKGKTLNSKKLDNLIIKLPPYKEQDRIVNKVSTIFLVIEKI